MATAIVKRFSDHNTKVSSTDNKKITTIDGAANAAKAAKKLFMYNKRIQQRTVKIEETSGPKVIKRYLKTITKSTFRGDVDGIDDADGEHIVESENQDIVCSDTNSQSSQEDQKEQQRRTDLGKVMKKLCLMIEAGKAFADDAKESIDEIAKLRSAGNAVILDEESYKEKLRQDYIKFLEYREDSIAKVEESKAKGIPMKPVAMLKHDDFWGTRQQLRSGKVVGDMLGGLDPVFGVLLNPTGKNNVKQLYRFYDVL